MIPSNISHAFVLFSAIFLTITIMFCLVRAIIGPKLTDRIVAVNVIGVKGIVLIALLSYYLDQPSLLDIALIYGLLSFLATIIFSQYVLQFKSKRRKSKKVNLDEAVSEIGMD